MFIKSILVFLISLQAGAAIKVVATLPELAWAAKEIGGDSVETVSLLSGNEDPHYVDASPAFVFKAAKADVIIYNGLELETGWLPKILQMSGHKKIQAGEAGNCDASEKIKKLETVENYDRSKGDIHPGGNPHYSLSAKSMILAGEKIRDCLAKAGEGDFEKSFQAYKSKLEKLHKEQSKKLSVLKKEKLMVYHREFSYLFEDYGIESSGSLEEVPGVLPSASYLTKSAKFAKKNKVSLVLASSVSPQKYLEKFKELTGIDFVMLQIHPRSGQDYIEFHQKLAQEIVDHVK